jgi:hypothetical protein
MPDILIRDIPEDIADVLTIKAREDGKDRIVWLKEQLIRLAAQPTIKTRYSFKAFGAEGAYATIERRYADHIQNGAKNCNEEQFNAYKKAVLHCERNELGDYEAAYKLLLSNFDEVFAS